jgi:sulfate transport system permease protein
MTALQYNHRNSQGATQDSPLAKVIIMTLSLSFFVLFLCLPLLLVFVEALQKGLAYYLRSLADPETRLAIQLTGITALIVVPLNSLFGLTAAWSLSKFHFPGKNILLTFIDIPFSISPVVAGLIYVLVFGAQGWLGHWLASHQIKIIFALPAIILVTLFVTFPYVARELFALMDSQGSEEEEAAFVLGANGWQTLWRVTLPNVKWGFLFGIILCNARAMGEFGAVSIVSGHIRGYTNTIPLQVEILYNDYNYVAAFTVASLLALLALITLGAKTYTEWRLKAELNKQPTLEGA